MKHIWCSGIPYIYWSIGGGYHLPSVYVHSSICETVFGVVVFHRSMVNWRRGALVYVHSAICETFWCSGIPYMYGQLEGGIHLP